MATKSIVVFGKSYCPHCRKVVDDLNSRKLKYKYVEMSDDQSYNRDYQVDLSITKEIQQTKNITFSNRSDLDEKLKAIVRDFYPMVFIDGKLVGGSEEYFEEMNR